MFVFIFSGFDPVLLHIGPLAVRWYGLAYVAGIFAALYILPILERKHQNKVLNTNNLDSLFVYFTSGLILGGRLGYVLFYHINWLYNNPLAVLKIWEGGMSFHGGLIGVVISLYLFARKYKLSFLRITDLFACVASIGLFFGRIANFLNSELYGRITDMPWAVVFADYDQYPRHPSQLYEAFFEGAFLLYIMLLLYYKTSLRKIPGKLSGVFLILYSVIRIVVECFREPDAHINFIFQYLTAGQLLCLPMLVTGAWLVIRKGISARAYGFEERRNNSSRR